MSEHWTYDSSFPPQGEARSWEFPPNRMAVCQGKRVSGGGDMNFPTGFNVVSFTLTWGAGAS